MTNKDQPLLYTPQQVNALTSISTPTLRFWEKDFPALFHIRRTQKGQRRYTIQDVETFKEIRRLVVEIGYNHREAYRVLLEEQTTNQQKEETP